MNYSKEKEYKILKEVVNYDYLKTINCKLIDIFKIRNKDFKKGYKHNYAKIVNYIKEKKEKEYVFNIRNHQNYENTKGQDTTAKFKIIHDNDGNYSIKNCKCKKK